jgi:tetratricopeptide (TPR) repeat protein/predicted Ser/Thr protein kinase
MEPGSDPLLGRVVGHYRLVKRLGEGGMGVVYLAVRADEIRRRVAIKLVRFSMDAPEMRGRFHAERQMLASLTHPNIIALLDAGTTEDSLPYLIMEYVEGRPLDSYVAGQQLSMAGRVALFLQICAAVDYAHRNLVVHCDLKPSNILITEEGVPKLLDFGIAKLLRQDPGEAGYVTQGRRPFTPSYASPEQLLGKPVTTATDIYSLGVILFELLTGGSPYRFETHSDAELVSAVCFHEAQRPSACAPGARRELEGDLDAIVLKALRKEPENRYGSAEQLAADLRAWRDGLPVGARKGGFRYQASKFVARNRLAVAAAALVVLALLGGAAGIAWEGRVAIAAGSRAERRFNDVRKLAKFLLYDFNDAVARLPGSTPVQQMLVERSLVYLDSLAKEAAGDPELELELAEAYLRLGDVQGNPYAQNLGDTAGAMASFKKALALSDELARGAPGARSVLRSQGRAHQRIGDILFQLREMKEATSQARQAVAIFERLQRQDLNDADARVDLAVALEGLADQLWRGLSDSAGALAHYQRALSEWQALVAAQPQHMRGRRALAGITMKIADVESEKDTRGALERYRSALAGIETLPASERSTVPSRRLEAVLEQKIADALWETGDRPGCLQHYQQAIAAFAALAALDPANTRAQFDYAVALNNSGESYEALGDLPSALRAYSQVADAMDSLLKRDPGNTAWRAHLSEILVKSGGLLVKAGQRAEARRQTARGLAAARDLGERPQTPAPELIRAARLLVLAEPADLREPQTAVRYARRAVELTKGADPAAFDTLALAQIAAGDGPGAGESVARGLALVPVVAGQPAPWLRRQLEDRQAELKKLGK